MDRGHPAREEPSASVCETAGFPSRDLEDEAAANAARERLRTSPLATLVPDGHIGPLLLPGERVLAIRWSALLERRQPTPRARTTGGLVGTLYLTSRRLVLVARTSLSFGLDAIQEVMLSGDRLFIALRDGQGLTLDVSEPRLFRVELAAARGVVPG